MKAISVQQPWAGLLVMGIKGFETRSWNTKHRGELAIHASAKIPKEGHELLDWLHEQFPMKGFDKGHLREILTTTGCVLGTIELISTHETTCSLVHYADLRQWNLEKRLGDWSNGRWAWNCDNPVLFNNPVPAKGQLSIWNWERPV